MATPKAQRIGIWIIAVVMLIGTLGSFAVMVLGSENDKKDQDAYNSALEEYQKQEKEKQAEADKEAVGLSKKYYPILKEYKDAPAKFDAGKVGDSVTTDDLKKGTGAVVKKDTTYKAYYIGWNPEGKMFDSSFDGSALKAPLDTGVMNVITGWNLGVEGMKVGGIREITIPSDLAYGDADKGADIPPNTPLKFIVMVIATN